MEQKPRLFLKSKNNELSRAECTVMGATNPAPTPGQAKTTLSWRRAAAAAAVLCFAKSR